MSNVKLIVLILLLIPGALRAESHIVPLLQELSARVPGLTRAKALPKEQYPGVVTFLVNSAKVGLKLGECGGVVINGCLLTANHCTQDMHSGIVYNGIGSSSEVFPDKIARLEGPKEKNLLGNDIAIVKLKKPIKGQYTSDILEDPPLHKSDDPGEKFEMVSRRVEEGLQLGMASFVGTYAEVTFGDWVKTANAAIRKKPELRQFLAKEFEAARRDQLVLLKADPSRGQHGDSGSPVFRKSSSSKGPFLFGVISRGDLERDGTGITSVIRHRKWVKEKLREFGCVQHVCRCTWKDPDPDPNRKFGPLMKLKTHVKVFSIPEQVSKKQCKASFFRKLRRAAQEERIQAVKAGKSRPEKNPMLLGADVRSTVVCRVGSK